MKALILLLKKQPLPVWAGKQLILHPKDSSKESIEVGFKPGANDRRRVYEKESHSDFDDVAE